MTLSEEILKELELLIVRSKMDSDFPIIIRSEGPENNLHFLDAGESQVYKAGQSQVLDAVKTIIEKFKGFKIMRSF